MSRWCTLTSLLLLWATAPADVRAQVYPGQPADGSQQAFFATPGQGFPAQPSGVMPAGWESQAYYGGEPARQKHKHSRSYGPPGPIPSGPGRTIYEELPDDTGWLYEDSPMERFLKDTFRHAYVRVDYLNWSVSDPGNNILGAPSNLTIDDPDSPFPIPVSDVPIIQITDQSGNPINAVQPSMAAMHNDNNNGMRLSFGLPVSDLGTFEANVFALQSSTSKFLFPDIRTADLDGDGIVDLSGLTPIDTNGDGVNDSFASENLVDAVVQGVTVDGILSNGNNFIIVNDVDYAAVLKTQVWGSEANFFLPANNPNDNLTIVPFFGVRYFNFSEELRQSGLYTSQVIDPATGLPQLDTDGNPVTVTASRKIDSTTINNLYGPQMGFRGELRGKYLTIGATPKVMLGANTNRATLDTFQVLNPNDPSQSIYDKTTTFGILGDLEVYSRLRLGEHMSAYVGYNLMWAGLITRPGDNVQYNLRSATAGQPAQSNFGLDVDYSGALIQGLNVGAQIEY